MPRAFVTGSSGFLGAGFYYALRERGYRVVGTDLNDSAYPQDAIEHFRRGTSNFDLVVHCAAFDPHRSAIDRSPLTVAAANLALDAELFNWAERVRPGRLVYVSSSAAYPTYLQEPGSVTDLREDMIDLSAPLVGTPDGSYGWLKLSGERMADWYRQSGGKITVIRPFSGYGDGQSGKFPFGAFLQRAIRGEDPFTVWGDGTQVRDWIHLDDVISGTFAAIEADVETPVNLCTGVGTSMLSLIELVCKSVGYSPEIQTRPDMPTGVARRVGDPSLMRTFYQPRMSLDEGVERALKHWKRWAADGTR